MPVKELRIIIENKPGSLQEICELLERHDIDIKALSIYGENVNIPVSLIVDATDRAYNLFKERNYNCSIEEVLAIEVPHHPGGLNSVLKLTSEEGININLLYTSINKKNNKAVFILKTDNIAKTEKILKNNWIQCIEHDAF